MSDAAAPPPPEGEDLPDFLGFSPVPVRARRDGWSAELQRRFVLDLARGASADEAARRLGRSRQTAYALRERAGADGFAAAWDAAVAFAARVRALGGGGAAASPFGGLRSLLVPRFYRGRLVGFVAREDRRGLMATLGRLDRLHDRIAARGPGALDALRAASERFGLVSGES